MIMVESRFRVANGLESSVHDAFINRPHLVDSAPGFLGMEVYEAADDATIFHLVTRWADQGSYDTWHRGEAHHASHAFMPRGLRLDASYTRLTILRCIEGGDPVEDDHRRLHDEMTRTNNDLAVLAREREAQRRELHEANVELARVHGELSSALQTLESSHWHIQRIHELLPMCLDCGEVKSGDGTWQSVRDFLMENATSPFLSHGYCPACAARVLASLDDELGASSHPQPAPDSDRHGT